MLVIDPAYGTLTKEGRLVQLSRKQMDIFMFLLRHRNKLVSKATLMKHLYGADIPDNKKILDVFLSKLRDRVSYFDITIETVWGRGLKLTINEQFDIAGTMVV